MYMKFLVSFTHTHTHNRFTALLEFVRDHPGEQVPESFKLDKISYCLWHSSVTDQWLLSEVVLDMQCMFVDGFVGGCCGARNRKTIIGGWGWAWWLVTDVQT